MTTAMKALIALIAATALLVPVGAALSTESVSKAPFEAEPREASELSLPVAPSMDIPWLNIGSTAPKADVMVGPKVDDLRPFLLPSTTAPTQFSSVWFHPTFLDGASNEN